MMPKIAIQLINYNTRYTLPLLSGLIVGFAFSLLCMPLFDCDTNLSRLSIENDISNHLRLKYDSVNQQLDDFEPRINLQGKPKKPQKATFKLIRPRYAATELGIREKLFIGVIVNVDTLSTLATAINRSVSDYTNKLMFFVNNLNIDEKTFYNSVPHGLSVISFNDNHEILKPFHTIQYILDNHINNYDWFMLVSDHTFIRGEKILDFLNHISISQDLYMGNIVNDIYCSLDSGIILSNTVMQKLVSQMEWCKNNAYSSEASDNIGRCILHTTSLSCSSYTNGRNFTYFYGENNIEFDRDINLLSQSSGFNQSLTVYPVKDLETMLQLQIYFDQVEMNEIKDELKYVEKNTIDMLCETPEGCFSATWPLGVPSPYHPANRYEVIRWDYFNETHIYLEGDFNVVNEMKEDYKYDVNEVIEFSIKNLNQNNNNRYTYVQLLNGYKQFDPTRGTTYILDLKLHDNQINAHIHKRVNIMRPLGRIELITMPYVTENSKVTFVITFSGDYNKEQIDAFFDNYQKSVLEISEVAEKLNLFAVFIRTNNTSNKILRKEIDSTIRYIKKVILELEKKFSSLTTSSSRILQTEIFINNQTLYNIESYRQLCAIEVVTRKLSPEALIFISPPGIDFEIEFLNRVRLNTIKGHQIFFPIGFYQYHHNIAYEVKPAPDQIEINKNFGYYNTYSYDFASFYNYDYINTRNSYISNYFNVTNSKRFEQISKTINLADYILDLYDLFDTNKSLHLMRANDQALKFRWHKTDNCDNRRELNEIQRCYSEMERGLGNRPQLAVHLVQFYEDANDAKQN